MNKDDSELLAEAIDLSEYTAKQGGFPVGALIVKDGEVLGRGASDGKRRHDPTLHAETDAIRQACESLSTRNLRGATLYSSMEPCLMCSASAYWSHVSKIVFGVSKDKLDPMHYEKGMGSGFTDSILEGWGIEVLHCIEQEDRALSIVKDWERATYG